MFAKVLIFAGISVAVYFAIALGLILSQRPGTLSGEGGLTFDGILRQTKIAPLPQGTWTAPDGTQLTYAHVPAPSPDAPLVLMVHGSGWYGGQFEALARSLGDLAEVKAVTLRGHGKDPARRGDVDYVGQFEDDLAALLAESDGRRRFLLGHSSGGGLVARFAGGKHGAMIDGAVLLAPFLQYDAPTTRPNSGGWAHVLTRRIIGLTMLNTVGIHALDHLTVIQFNMPQVVLDGPLGGYATTAYSMRLNTGFAPRRDWKADVAALPPFLLVAGAEDEAMVAGAYEPILSEVTDRGDYVVVEGAGHLDIVDHPETRAAIRDYLK
ncbi:alpha/beta fold hydrolase [Maritimibacter sp. DP1N21-5]|uniref:alpha/beta hydrolase n=1 Tax=Maritimibacter sp. DP1N21-5 TaxID=2836867 RepID=UPI001C44DDCF|nr:alpha/beta fold hydrolase [Maritimibacter sp. DP1N21-5]MBV7409975.1 lysophospholipase [Maritimibacter sp. DP1N21-5]